MGCRPCTNHGCARACRHTYPVTQSASTQPVSTPIAQSLPMQPVSTPVAQSVSTQSMSTPVRLRELDCKAHGTCLLGCSCLQAIARSRTLYEAIELDLETRSPRKPPHGAAAGLPALCPAPLLFAPVELMRTEPLPCSYGADAYRAAPLLLWG